MQERIRTTQTKAKRLRPVAERLITLGKSGSVHARRQALSMIEDRDVIHKLFSDIGPRFSERSGGYTRVLKLGPRQGDAAPMAIIELIETGVVEESAEETGKRRRRGLRRRKPAAEAVESTKGTETDDENEPVAETEPEVVAEDAEAAEPVAEVEAEPVAETEPEVVAEEAETPEPVAKAEPTPAETPDSETK